MCVCANWVGARTGKEEDVVTLWRSLLMCRSRAIHLDGYVSVGLERLWWTWEAIWKGQGEAGKGGGRPGAPLTVQAAPPV